MRFQEPFFSRVSPGSMRMCPWYKDQLRMGAPVTSLRNSSLHKDSWPPFRQRAVETETEEPGLSQQHGGESALLSALDQEAPDGP